MTPIQAISNPSVKVLITSPWSLVEDVIRQKGLENSFNKTGLTPLEASMWLQDLSLCQKVLALQEKLDPPKPFEESLLFLALRIGNESIALWLIEIGVDVHLQNAQGINYLHMAAQTGRQAVVKVLLEKGLLMDSTAQLPFPEVSEEYAELKEPFMLCTPLHFAVFYRRKEMVEWLLTQGADGNKGTSIYTPFLMAFFNNLEEILPLFKKENFNLDAAKLGGEPLLHYFVLIRKKEWVEKLLKLGANPNLSNSGFYTPLYIAYLLNEENLFKLLVENGADLNAKTHGATFLYYESCKPNKTQLFHYLLEKGANPNLPQDDSGRTPLHQSIVQKQEEYVTLLLKYGADVNPKEIEGNTPLHFACLLERYDYVKLLLEHKAEVNAFNAIGETPLHLAKSEQVVDLLLDAGAEAQVINNEGLTPLGSYYKKMNQQFVRLKKLDAGLTPLILQLRLLGHRFSISGSWMEGFKSSKTYNEMGVSLQEFLPSLPNDLQKALQPISIQFLKSAKFDLKNKDTYEDALLHWKNSGEELILPLSWNKHAVALFLKGQYVIKGNCGQGATESGLTIFKLENTEKCYKGLIELIEVIEKKGVASEVTKETPFSELQEKYTQKAIHYFNHTMIETMGLTKLDHIHLRDQKTGNCTWKAAKLSFHAALIAYFLEVNGDLKESIKQAKKIYIQWKNFDNEKGLRQLVEIAKEPRITRRIDVNNIYYQVFKASAKKKNSSLIKLFIELIPSFLSWKEPKTGLTAVHLVQDVESLKVLITEKVDLFEVDNKGENAFHKALFNGNMPLVRFFIEELNTHIFQKNSNDLTPLDFAIYGGYSEPVYYLLSTGVISKEGAPQIPYKTKGRDASNTPLIHMLLNYRINSIMTYLIHLINQTSVEALLNLLDSEGNNLLHMLAYHALNPEFDSLMNFIQMHVQEHFQALLNAKNHAGKFPVDIYEEVMKSKTHSNA